MCHAPAICFQVEKRGFLKEGFYADIAIMDIHEAWKVTKENILYKCNWSPFEEHTFTGNITHTFVNGHLAYNNGIFDESKKGERLLFNRN